MTKIKKQSELTAILTPLLSQKVRAGVTPTSQKRKAVLHTGNPRSSARGLYNPPAKKAAKATNTAVLVKLDTQKFKVLDFAFDKTKNKNLQQYTRTLPFTFFADKPQKIENATVAAVRNFLDTQKFKKNSATWAKIKGFNKFGVDSRQLQKSIASSREISKHKIFY